jgi:hypothetical protein
MVGSLWRRSDVFAVEWDFAAYGATEEVRKFYVASCLQAGIFGFLPVVSGPSAL